MTTEEAIRRIEHSRDYSHEQVKEAINEFLSGEHGEFLRLALLALVDHYGIEGADACRGWDIVADF